MTSSPRAQRQRREVEGPPQARLFTTLDAIALGVGSLELTVSKLGDEVTKLGREVAKLGGEVTSLRTEMRAGFNRVGRLEGRKESVEDRLSPRA